MYKQIAQRRYKHGDEDVDRPGSYYCAACDVFVVASHLAGDPGDPVDVRRHVAAARGPGAFARR
jgi:hypothetical protein